MLRRVGKRLSICESERSMVGRSCEKWGFWGGNETAKVLYG